MQKKDATFFIKLFHKKFKIFQNLWTGNWPTEYHFKNNV